MLIVNLRGAWVNQKKKVPATKRLTFQTSCSVDVEMISKWMTSAGAEQRRPGLCTEPFVLVNMTAVKVWGRASLWPVFKLRSVFLTMLSFLLISPSGCDVFASQFNMLLISTWQQPCKRKLSTPNTYLDLEQLGLQTDYLENQKCILEIIPTCI